MASGMQQPEDPLGAIHPIGATVFGANVLAITRGDRTEATEEIDRRKLAVVNGDQLAAFQCASRRAGRASPEGSAQQIRLSGMAARPSRFTDWLEPTFLRKS